ncbi:MAG: protein kinase [Chloroflexi bacterium]|nr:protein kinase [Chloroflexota bacterium]
MKVPEGERIPKTDTTGRLNGFWLVLARSGWIALLILAVWLYLAAVPAHFRALTSDCDSRPCTPFELQAAVGVQSIGLTGSFVAWYFIAIDTLVTAVFLATAVLIFWRRSDNRMVLFTATMLLAIGATFGPEISSLIVLQPRLLPLLLLLQAIGWGALVIFLFVFPSGRFVPEWSKWLAGASILALIWVLIDSGSKVYFSRSFFAVLGLTMTLGSSAQIYRFRRVATPAQRQQTKWVSLGFVSLLGLTSIGIIPGLLSPAVMQSVLFHMIRVPLFAALPLSMLPLTLARSMLRHRLWDVDFIINRSLVYGIVSLLLAGVFLGAFFGLHTLTALVFGEEQDFLSAAVSAGAIVALFGPTRNMLRHTIDQRLYGIKLDYEEAAKAYSRPERVYFPTGNLTTTIGNYSELTLLGRGGMGEIYLGYDPRLERKVAIKLLPSHTAGNEDAERRLKREAQTVAGLKHPNIVTLHEIGEHAGQPYIVMEYIDGMDLSRLLRERGRLPLEEALSLLEDVASALDYAHQSGVIHRDIKPSNVMVEKVTASGGGQNTRAVLMDFGVAKSYAAGTRLTQSGMIGTLDYIAPEQIQGAAGVDARADIYALGVMTFQLLTGRLPFEHNNPGAMVMAHLMQPQPDPRELAPNLPEGAALAIQRAMEKQPDGRFTTAGEFITAMGD